MLYSYTVYSNLTLNHSWSTFPKWILGHLCVQLRLWPSAAATTVSSDADFFFFFERLIWSLPLCCLLHLLHRLHCCTTSSSVSNNSRSHQHVCPRSPQLPVGHEAGHAEVKVPISPELGPLSHLFLQNCGKSAGQRRTDRLVGRSLILFQTWCFYWTPWPNATLMLIWLQQRCWIAQLCAASLRSLTDRGSQNVRREVACSAILPQIKQKNN